MQRTPAILIPGTLCDGRVFEPMAPQLDLEPTYAPPISHGDPAGAAEAALSAAPARFVAVGFSLGGFVVLEMMRRAPERLLGAVLIATNAEPLPPDQAAARREDVAFARDAGMEAMIQRLWPLYVAPARVDDQALRGLVEAMAVTVGAKRFAAQAELAIVRPSSHATLRESKLPLLAICGQADAINPPARCHGLVKGANARLVAIEGSGHFVPLEAPGPAAAAINRWAKEAALCC